MNLKEAEFFVSRFITGDYAPEEYTAFLNWLEKASTDDLGAIADEHEALRERWSLTTAGPSSQWMEQLEKKLDRVDQEKQASVRRLYKQNFYTRRGFKWMAAASVLTLLAGGGYLWYSQQAALRSGQGLNKLAEASLQSFSTPRGGHEQEFELTDGSKVWLNAASTLKYPSSFNGKERVVELSGEAFFEIAKKADMPFRVKIRDAKIEVLGTQFNIMAYADEPVSKTTLLEGAIKVVRESEETLLKPGEQAEIVYPSSGEFLPIKLNRGMDQESMLAWKSGELNFKDDDLHTVMRTIARCYDVEVKYEGNVREKHFTGIFSRKEDLNEILKELKNQHIHVRFTGKTITVVS